MLITPSVLSPGPLGTPSLWGCVGGTSIQLAGAAAAAFSLGTDVPRGSWNASPHLLPGSAAVTLFLGKQARCPGLAQVPLHRQAGGRASTHKRGSGGGLLEGVGPRVSAQTGPSSSPELFPAGQLSHSHHPPPGLPPVGCFPGCSPDHAREKQESQGPGGVKQPCGREGP